MRGFRGRMSQWGGAGACRKGMILALVLTSCGGGEEPVREETIRPVKYQKVLATGGTRVRAFSGAAKAGVESRLSFRVGGAILRLLVEVGDKVQKDELIAELDDTDYQLKVREAAAALVQAEAQLRNAKANFERIRALYENKNASLNDYDTTRTAVDTTAAAVQAVGRRRELALQQVTYTRLRAPSHGAISEVKAEVNENVSTGQTVVILTSGTRPEVEVAIPEQLIAQIRQGSKVAVTFDAIPGGRFSATVTEVGVASSEFATTFPVRVRLTRGDSRIRPGMSAEVAFRFGSKARGKRLWVPTHAVGEDRQGRFVYVAKPEGENLGRVARRSVQVGELTAKELEIVEGLSSGELVVTAGRTRIVDGQIVKILTATK